MNFNEADMTTTKIAKSAELKLTVDKADRTDAYTDIARINRKSRGGLEKGNVFRISVAGVVHPPAYIILRGNPKEGMIDLDEMTRSRLGIKQEREYTFLLQRCGFFGELRWAWSATDPAYRIAAKLGVLSLWLGILSMVLALIPLFLPFSGTPPVHH